MENDMIDIIFTEIGKLKRYPILKAGLIVVILSDLFGFVPVLANDGVRKDFTLLMNNILESNCVYFFPAMIILIGGFIARREYTDDTLENILTVPVSLRKLLLGKVFVLFFMTILFSAFSVLSGILLCFAAGLPDCTLPFLVEWTARIILGNALLFVAVLPFTIVSTLFADAVYACTATGFVYGFFASMESAMLNYHPVKAVLILVDPQCGAGYDFVHYSKVVASITLLAIFLISAALFVLLKPAGTQSKARTLKKITRVKGW